jgi:hypothetical protein
MAKADVRCKKALKSVCREMPLWRWLHGAHVYRLRMNLCGRRAEFGGLGQILTECASKTGSGLRYRETTMDQQKLLQARSSSHEGCENA